MVVNRALQSVLTVDPVVQANIDMCGSALIARLMEFVIPEQSMAALEDSGCTNVALFAALGDQGGEKKFIRSKNRQSLDFIPRRASQN